jgi:hypothetical protein
MTSDSISALNPFMLAPTRPELLRWALKSGTLTSLTADHLRDSVAIADDTVGSP